MTVLRKMKFRNSDQQRMNMSIIEKLFSHKESTTLTLVFWDREIEGQRDIEIER